MVATRNTVARKVDLEAIVSKYYAALYRFGFALTKSESDAADLTQETFLLLTKHQNQIRRARKDQIVALYHAPPGIPPNEPNPHGPSGGRVPTRRA